MSRVFSALVFAASVSAMSPAVAADMYGGAAPAPSYGGYSDGSSRPADQWTGAYAGPQVGYAWGKGGVHGPQGGVYGGVNTAVGSNIVVGAEAEINVSGQERYTVFSGNLMKQSSDWNANVRARAGVAFDKFMPYATVGVAFADDTVKGLGASDTTTKVGYVVGVGVEGRVSDRISVKGEVLHSGFGDTDHVVSYTTVRNNASQTVLRTGAAYKF